MGKRGQGALYLPEWRPATTLINGAEPKSQTSRTTPKILDMVTVMLQHEVKDFAEWKKIFDADETNRAQAGVKLVGVYSSVKNPNDVTMVFEIPDAGIMDAMMSDPERQKAMETGGVISKPSVSVLNKVG